MAVHCKLCIGNSVAEADALYQQTRDVLDMETDAARRGRGQLLPMFDDFPHLMD